MPNVGDIWYDVDIRTRQAVGRIDGLEERLNRLENEFRNVDRSANGLSSGLSKLAKVIGAVIAATALRDMANMVQGYQEMAERVQMATASQEEFENVQKRLLTTANGTYRSLAEAQELYIRTADSLRSMGYNTSQAIDVTDSMSYAFVKNATSADRAQGAITAVSKAFNTGKVAADQWETITVALPSIIDDIATSSGKTSAQVRALGAAGKLTAQDLSEGLRKSLDENAQAAAGMANNMTDAGVRTKTALTMVLVALEEQTGALNTFTNSIITAADIMIEFAGDTDSMEKTITLLGLAIASTASVIAGRMVMAMGQYTYAQATALIAARQRMVQEQAAAAAAVRRTLIEKQVAIAALATARAEFQAAAGTNAHTLAATALVAAQTRAAAAAGAYAAAQNAANGVARVGTVVMGTLSRVMAFLGGPLGVVLLAATAIYAFGGRAREAKAPTDDLTKSVQDLSAAQRELAKLEATQRIDQLSEQAKLLGDNLKYAEEQTGGASKRSQRFAEDAIRMRVEIEKTNEELGKYKGRLEDLNKGVSTPGKTTDSSDTPALTPVADPTAEKAANKATNKAAEAAERAAETIAETVAALEMQADVLGMTETELELYKLQLAGASDAQIQAAATSRGLIDAYEMQTEAAKEAAEAEAKHKEELQNKLMAASPEAAAKTNFEKELADLKTLNEAKLLSNQEYLDLKLQSEMAYDEQRRIMEEEAFMRQSTANTLLIESLDAMGQASTQALSGLLSGATNGQEAMRSLANTILNTVIGTFTKMGTEWVKQQIIQRAATQATIATQQAGIGAVAATQQAATASMAATTTATAATTGAAVTTSMAPAAGVASVASFGGAAVAGIAALLASMAIARGISGGRQYGGPVSANGMYRINENGAPEVFNAANGRQYMLPNTRGDVVSNKDAAGSMGGSGGGVFVNVHNNASGAQATASSRETDEGTIIDIVVSNLYQDGPIGQAVNSITGTERAGR